MYFEASLLALTLDPSRGTGLEDGRHRFRIGRRSVASFVGCLGAFVSPHDF